MSNSTKYEGRIEAIIERRQAGTIRVPKSVPFLRLKCTAQTFLQMAED
jgi:hypothetical protein